MLSISFIITQQNMQLLEKFMLDIYKIVVPFVPSHLFPLKLVLLLAWNCMPSSWSLLSITCGCIPPS